MDASLVSLPAGHCADAVLVALHRYRVSFQNPAKASTNVKVGDEIEILFGQKSVKVRVTDIQDTTKKEQAKDLFEYIS